MSNAFMGAINWTVGALLFFLSVIYWQLHKVLFSKEPKPFFLTYEDFLAVPRDAIYARFNVESLWSEDALTASRDVIYVNDIYSPYTELDHNVYTIVIDTTSFIPVVVRRDNMIPVKILPLSHREMVNWQKEGF